MASRRSIAATRSGARVTSWPAYSTSRPRPDASA
jgi:hypothetical protein